MAKPPTPGPWRAVGDNVLGPDGRAVALGARLWPSTGDARLIAAAPDLLAACYRALDVLQAIGLNTLETQQVLSDAILAATNGEGL